VNIKYYNERVVGTVPVLRGVGGPETRVAARRRISAVAAGISFRRQQPVFLEDMILMRIRQFLLHRFTMIVLCHELAHPLEKLQRYSVVYYLHQNHRPM
jgi:glycogen synthase